MADLNGDGKPDVLTDQIWTHAVGAWSAGPIGPLYQAFVPAAFADDPGVGQNLFLAENLRARWAARVFGQAVDDEPLDHMTRIQEMLDMGAEQFDQVLRQLPPGTDPEDVRELFEALREQRNRGDEPASGQPGGPEAAAPSPAGPPVLFECTACGMDLSAPTAVAGDTMACPRRRQRVRIPGPSQADAGAGD